MDYHEKASPMFGMPADYCYRFTIIGFLMLYPKRNIPKNWDYERIRGVFSENVNYANSPGDLPPRVVPAAKLVL